MDMICFPVEFNNVGLEIGTDNPKDTMKPVQRVYVKDMLPVSRHKHEMSVELKHHMPTSSERFILTFHFRPSRIGLMITVFKYRVKSTLGFLGQQSRKVNFVWNYCNNTQKKALDLGRKWISRFDFQTLVAGTSKELALHSQTIQAVCKKYTDSREAKKKPFLRYRGRKNLGWIPVCSQAVTCNAGVFLWDKHKFRVFYSRPIPSNAEISDGTNFSQDSLGNWYLNICLSLPDVEPVPVVNEVGIDLGLKELAVLSTGETIKAPQHYRKSEDNMAVAQRAKKKRQVIKIHARTANVRKDFLHKLSTSIANRFQKIVVGNVCPSALVKTNMAKSVLDAGWSSFRNMLRYKAIARGGLFEEVNEAYTTQACSDCGSISGPKGQSGLGIREWTCSSCGSSHNRDHNSAINILRLGHETPTVGILALCS
jgi:IS605 OrfB family transposase